MSGTHRVTARHPPPNVGRIVSKAARSAPPSRHAGTPKIMIQSTSHKPAKQEEGIFDFEDDEMATSFLQYCAICDRQIIVPNSNVLYCSESCRRRDVTPPATHPYLSLSLATSYHMPPQHPTIDDPFGKKLPTYIPALQPTPRSYSNNVRIPSVDHQGKSDLDPTEWKPADQTLGGGNSPTLTESKMPPAWKPKLYHRGSSDASNFLRTFHQSSESVQSKRRPGLGQSQSNTTKATPSLSHTPTASTSSEESLAGTPYEFVSRPAVSMPTTSVSTNLMEDRSTARGADELSYEKQAVSTDMRSASGSLKNLLRTAEM